MHRQWSAVWRTASNGSSRLVIRPGSVAIAAFIGLRLAFAAINDSRSAYARGAAVPA